MNPIELLNTVNAFYDQAFNRLLIITFGIMALIGVIVPIAVGWVQLRTLRSEKSSIFHELKSEIAAERQEIEAKIDSQVKDQVANLKDVYETRFKEITNNLEKTSAAAEARSFHLQGLSSIKSENAFLGAKDFCHGARLYVKAADESNAQRCIRSLIEDCLPKTDMDQYKKFKIEKECKNLVDKLNEVNENGRYSNDIQRIEFAMEAASTRASKSTSVVTT